MLGCFVPTLMVSYLHFSSFTMDKRWHCIYTVWLDLLNSPEVRDIKDLKPSVPFQNLGKAKLIVFLRYISLPFVIGGSR